MNRKQFAMILRVKLDKKNKKLPDKVLTVRQIMKDNMIHKRLFLTCLEKASMLWNYEDIPESTLNLG